MFGLVRFLSTFLNSLLPGGSSYRRIEIRYIRDGSVKTLTIDQETRDQKPTVLVSLNPSLVLRGYETDAKSKIRQPITRHVALGSIVEVEIGETDPDDPESVTRTRWVRDNKGRLRSFTES